MKIDVFQWQELTNGKEYQNETGALRIMCGPQSAVYVQVEGYEVLAGYGPRVEVEISEPFTFKVIGPKAERAFVRMVERVPYLSTGEVFTNIDRKPLESGAVLEVTRALRAFKLEQRRVMEELQFERRKLEAAKAPKPTESAPVDPAPADSAQDPAPEPAPAAAPEAGAKA